MSGKYTWKCNKCGKVWQGRMASKCPACSSFAAPTGLAARVVVNQALVDEIIRRAQDSNFGLSEREASVDITHYAQPNMDALAMLLVGAWSAKYDIVSVFSAAMSVIQEKAANVEPCDGGTKKL